MEVTRILNRNYPPTGQWSNRNKKSGYFSKLRQRIRIFLNSLSGNDLSSMIADILNKDELANLQFKYAQTLRLISQAVNNKKIIKSKSKHHFIRPARLSGLSLQETKELGFVCNKKLWASCLDTNERHQGGRRRTDAELVEEIKVHMESLTNIGANRTVVIRNFAERNPREIYKKRKISQQIENVRYRTTTLNEAFRQYKLRDNHLNDQRRNFRFLTFKKYVDKRFKKPQKSTDLCEFCQFGKSIEKELKAEFLNYDLGYFENNSWKDTLFYLAQFPLNDPNLHNIIDQPSIRNKIGDLKLVEFHRSIAERQRKAYNQIRLNTAA
jgi:hypothetical protein